MPNSRQEEFGSSDGHQVPTSAFEMTFHHNTTQSEGEEDLLIDTGSVDGISGNVVVNRKDGAAKACVEQASVTGITQDGIFRNWLIPTLP